MEKPLKMRFSSILLITAFLAGCSVFKPYKIDIPQGNLVTTEMLAQVEVGMTREQVAFALGTPALDPFLHPDQWVYFYQLESSTGKSQHQLIKLYFEGDELVKIQGNANISDSDL